MPKRIVYMKNKKIIFGTLISLVIFAAIFLVFVLFLSRSLVIPQQVAPVSDTKSQQQFNVKERNSVQKSDTLSDKLEGKADDIPMESGDENEYLGEDEVDDIEKAYDSSDKDLVF